MSRIGFVVSIGIGALLAACSSEAPEDSSERDFVVIEASPTTFDSIGVGSWEVEDSDTDNHSAVRGYDLDGQLVTVIDNDDDGTLVFVEWKIVDSEREESDSLMIHPEDGLIVQTSEEAVSKMGAVRNYYQDDLEVANENADVPAFSNSAWCTSFRDAFAAPASFGDSDPFATDWTDLAALYSVAGDDAAVCLGCYGLAGSSLVDPEPVTQGDLGAGAGPMCGGCASALGVDQSTLGGLFLCQVETE